MEFTENLLEGREPGEAILYADAVVSTAGPGFAGAVTDRAIYWGTGAGQLRRAAIADVQRVKLSHRGHSLIIAGIASTVFWILAQLASYRSSGVFLFLGIVLLLTGWVVRQPRLAVSVSGQTYTWKQPSAWKHGRSGASGGLQRRYFKVLREFAAACRSAGLNVVGNSPRLPSR